MINIDRKFLSKAFGEECVNTTSTVADVYKVGLSGSFETPILIENLLTSFPGRCRVKNGKTRCKSHLSSSLGWVGLLQEDYAAANATGKQADITGYCNELIDLRGVDHELSDRLALAILALLLASLFLNMIGLLVAWWSESAFGVLVFIPSFIDEVLLAVCLGLYLGILNYEVGEYIPGGKKRDMFHTSILGVGFWMLLGIFSVRAISSPTLFIVTLLVALSIPLGFFSLILCIFGDGSTVVAVTRYVTRVVFG